MFAIAAGYEDADDCDSLRYDPIFKMAVGRGPRKKSRQAGRDEFDKGAINTGA
jgi:hypothetical protein